MTCVIYALPLKYQHFIISPWDSVRQSSQEWLSEAMATTDCERNMFGQFVPVCIREDGSGRKFTAGVSKISHCSA